MKSSYRFLKVPLCLFSDSYSQLSVEANRIHSYLLKQKYYTRFCWTGWHCLRKMDFWMKMAVCLCTIRTARCAERFAVDLKRRRGYFVSLKNIGWLIGETKAGVSRILFMSINLKNLQIHYSRTMIINIQE